MEIVWYWEFAFSEGFSWELGVNFDILRLWWGLKWVGNRGLVSYRLGSRYLRPGMGLGFETGRDLQEC